MRVPDQVTLMYLGVVLYLKAGRIRNQLLTWDICRGSCCKCSHGNCTGRYLSLLLGPGAAMSGYWRVEITIRTLRKEGVHARACVCVWKSTGQWLTLLLILLNWMEVALGSVETRLLLYYKFGFLVDSQPGNSIHFGSCSGVVIGLFLLTDGLSGSWNWANNCFLLVLQVPLGELSHLSIRLQWYIDRPKVVGFP